MKPNLITVCAVISGVLSVTVSEVSSPRYLGLVITALGLGCICAITCGAVLTASHNKLRYAILGVLLPVLVFGIDNVGRLMHILGFGGFRILISA